MIGTLRTPIGGIPLRLPPPNSTGSTSKVFLGGGRTCKASMHAVLDSKPVAQLKLSRPESLYEVLRVERNATPTEIKTAYRSLAKLYHPDASDFKQQGDRDFIEIHNAYATLSDPEARATYDLKWSTGVRRKSGLYTAVVKRQGFYTCRRWETDQCW
ncbi:unnamed protein product [Lactuca virosa]|uniref:J domain-containing protein n=1 Tax=Lactuca virosa TaxID=75947 RepID=A0AAU9PKW8_9ASTR|nr:unnamed protein product [Lactuca virosa]